MADLLEWILIGLSVPFFVAMVMYTVRRARELDRRIQEYHAEQEAEKNRPGPINPYEQMAGLFGADTTDRRPTTRDSRPGEQGPLR